ncbi:MAG TPA: DUF1801 domain-containing protein [Tepidisphaeraceae bacterium]|nr:DUF1801 domain-containing protein [Tepidisphaeraceae bacterium]
MLFPNAVSHEPAIEDWMCSRAGALRDIAKYWFNFMRACGDDVRELLHDGHPTACVGEAAFCYVNAFSAHVNVGFFLGAGLPDPHGLMEGTGKFMRHVKIKSSDEINQVALEELIMAAYRDMKSRINSTRT